MTYGGWENNPNGICEDAPCCGCCGPQGDGQISDEPPEFDFDGDYDPYDEDDGNFDPEFDPTQQGLDGYYR